MNGDGNLDLVVANEGSDNVSVLLGNGAGNFDAATHFSAGAGPYFIAMGDLNGDGTLDLAVANVFSNTVSVLYGDGVGHFGAPSYFMVGNNPSSIAIGDANGDGNLDLAVASYGVGWISVLLGNDQPLTAHANIQVDLSNINDVPVLQNNNVSISEGQASVFFSNNLSATDEDNVDDSALLFTVTNVQQGRFELINNPGVAQTSFTQQKVQNGEVHFIHDGSLTAPSFEVSVSDGFLSSVPVAGNVNFNTYPRLEKNNLSVERGQTVVLSQNNFKATDTTNVDLNLIFMISNLQRGSFRTTHFVSQFSQLQMLGGQVQFVHDGSSSAPSFKVAVSDGQLTTLPTSAEVAFSDGGAAESTQDTTVRDAIISGSVAGAVSFLFCCAVYLCAKKCVNHVLEKKKESRDEESRFGAGVGLMSAPNVNRDREGADNSTSRNSYSSSSRP